MASIRRFEEINAWQRARELASEVYEASRQVDFRRDFALRDQIRRSAISVMANIAEGFGRRSNKEFIQFLYISKGSCVEVMSHLYVAKDQKYLTEEDFERLMQGYRETQGMLVNFIKYLEQL